MAFRTASRNSFKSTYVEETKTRLFVIGLISLTSQEAFYMIGAKAVYLDFISSPTVRSRQIFSDEMLRLFGVE